MAIDPVPAFPFPRRPFSSITPFTYSDAMTHLELLEKLRVYAGVTLPDEINKVLDEYSIEITAEVQAAIDLMIGTLNDKIVEINDALADQKADYTQKISDLTVYVDDAVQQIINNSIEVQDPVVAGIIGDSSSQTREALNENYVQSDVLSYNAKDHGVIGDGVADDTQTMQALIDAAPDGATIVAPIGARYRTDGWRVENRSLTIDLSNAHITKTNPAAPIFEAEGSFSDPVSVVGITTNQRYTSMLPANLTGFSRGDVVKVFSDNEIADSRPRNATEKSWQGEFAVIMDIVNGEIRISPPLIDTYTANPRIAKLNNNSVTFKFGTAEHDHAPTPDFSGSMFEFRAMQSSHLAGHVLRGPGTAFTDRSSVYTTADLRVENLPPQDGYGVSCSGSSWGEYRIIANRLRHAFTDDPSGRHEIGQTDPVNFGRPTYAKITGRSVSTTRVPWDTHHGGYGFHFYDITATGTDARWLFRIRGRNHTLSNCIGIGAESGFGIMEEDGIPGGAETNAHRFVNCATYRVGQPFNVAKNTHVNPEIDSVTIEGGRFEFFRQGPTIEYGSIRMVDPVLVYTDGTYSYEGPAFFNVINGRLTGSVSLNAETIPAGGAPSYIFRGSNLPTTWNEIDVEAKIRLSDSARHEVTAIMQWNSTRGRVIADVRGNHAIEPSWDMTGDAATQSVLLTNFNSNTALTSAWRSLTPGDGDKVPIRGRDAVLTCRINATSAVTLGVIERGAFAGQLLDLYVIGSGTVTVLSSGMYNTALIDGNDKTLQPRDSMRLVWDATSTAWVQLT